VIAVVVGLLLLSSRVLVRPASIRATTTEAELGVLEQEPERVEIESSPSKLLKSLPSDAKPGASTQLEQTEQMTSKSDAGDTKDAKTEATEIRVKHDGYEMQVLTGGTRSADKPVFVLIHGGHRQLQNAEFWRKHFGLLAELGQFFAVSCLGHGTSVPGPEDDKDTSLPQVEMLEKLVTEHIFKGEKEGKRKVVVIGRSWGGSLTMELVSKHPDWLDRLVLIAPAVQPNAVYRAPASVRQTPTLLCWAEQDPTVPFSRADALMDTRKGGFTKAQLVNFGAIKTHIPEFDKPDVFQAALKKFILGEGEKKPAKKD